MRLPTLLIFLVLCSASGNKGFAQGKEKLNAPITLRGCIGIPKPITSQMFRRSFTGIYEVNISFNLRLIKNFYGGAGYQNTLMRNNEFLKRTYFNNKIPYNTRLAGNAGY